MAVVGFEQHAAGVDQLVDCRLVQAQQQGPWQRDADVEGGGGESGIEAYLIPFVRMSGYAELFVHPSRIVRVRFEGRDLLVGMNANGVCGVVEGRAVVEAGDEVEFLDRLARFIEPLGNR